MANFNLGNLVWKITADSAQFQSGIKSSESALSKFETGAKAVGSTLTKALTLPILGAAGAAVKFASDLQESTNAVNVTFGDSARIITAWGENAATQAGLSRSEFNETATQIGVLLQQTGKDFDAVAEDTIELTQRAADLASIYNTDVKDATIALGAALRGESEPARRYGVLLSENAVQAKALELGLGGLTGELTEADKVQARYAIILESTAAVAGDFANTSEDSANSLRVLRAQSIDLAADLGQELLPIFADLLNGARDLVSQFSDLTDEQKSNVIQVGLTVAAIGPLLAVLGSTVTAVRNLKTAVDALNKAGMLGPTGLIVAAGLAAVGIGELVTNMRTGQVDEFAESIGDLNGQLTPEQLEKFGEALFNLQENLVLAERAGINLSIADALEAGARNAGLTNTEFARLVLQASNVSFELRDGAQALIEQEQRAEAIRDLNESVTESVTRQREEQARIRAELQAQREEQQRILEAVNERYKGAREAVLQILSSEVTEYQRIQAQIDELENSPWAAGQLEQDRLAALEILRTRQEEIRAEEIQAVQDEEFAKTLARVEADRAQRDVQLETIASVQAAERELADEKELADKAESERAKQLAIERLQTVRDVYSQITGIVGMAFDNEITRIQQSTDSEKEKAEKIADLKIKQAKYEKAATLAQIAIDTAGAVVKSLPNIPLAILSGALGAAQFAIAASTPLPTFESPSAPSTPSTPSPSTIPEERTPSTSATSRTADSGSGNGQTINFTQNNIVNLDTDENIGKAARVLFPALKAEGIRRGETL